MIRPVTSPLLKKWESTVSSLTSRIASDTKELRVAEQQVRNIKSCLERDRRNKRSK